MDITQTPPSKLTKKEARKQVVAALLSLTDLSTALGKKKFKSRLKKAERLFSAGLPKAVKKKKNKKANVETAV